jgi:hypothetical protein
MLSHIYQVRKTADPEVVERGDKPPAYRSLYQKYLFYRTFVALDRPVLVPEGKTDSVYIRCAIKRLQQYHPRLGVVSEGGFETKIRCLSYSRTFHEIMQLGGGAAQLNAFVEQYHWKLRSFHHAPLGYPVIVLIDNDQGGQRLFGAVNRKSGLDVGFRSRHLFYHLGSNLYVIKTPEGGVEPHHSCIEDLFPDSLRTVVLDGKSFRSDREWDDEETYGKMVFATKVIEPNIHRIDFSGFVPLLDRVLAVLDHYERWRATHAARVD